MSIHESHKVTQDEFESLAFQSFWLKLDYDYEDVPAGLTVTYPVPLNHVILGVAHVVTAGFSGSALTLDIGDGSNDDGYVDNTNLTLGTLGNFYYGGGGANALAQGTFDVDDAQKVVLTFNEAPTAGAGSVLIHCLGLGTSWRIP